MHATLKTFCSLSFCLLILLAGCAHRYANQPAVNANLLQEHWQSDVVRSPNTWTAQVNPWFLHPPSPYPHRVRDSVLTVPIPRTIHAVTIAGRYQVQFVQSLKYEMTIEGPAPLVQQVWVHRTKNVLYLGERKDASPNIACVVVRIGLPHIALITQLGPGLITGQIVQRDDLCVLSYGRGDLYLAGTMRVTGVKAYGAGKVTLLGVMSPHVIIATRGTGDVNLYGNVGARLITHRGRNNINIIGVNTHHLTLYASGCGKVGLYGQIGLDCVTACGSTRVYAYNILNRHLTVKVNDGAEVGLAGYAQQLDVTTTGGGSFRGYRLYTRDTNARALDASHITTRASNQLFASAFGESSIYAVKSAAALTANVKQNGVVLPIPNSSN